MDEAVFGEIIPFFPRFSPFFPVFPHFFPVSPPSFPSVSRRGKFQRPSQFPADSPTGTGREGADLGTKVGILGLFPLPRAPSLAPFPVPFPLCFWGLFWEKTPQVFTFPPLWNPLSHTCRTLFPPSLPLSPFPNPFPWKILPWHHSLPPPRSSFGAFCRKISSGTPLEPFPPHSRESRLPHHGWGRRRLRSRWNCRIGSVGNSSGTARGQRGGPARVTQPRPRWAIPVSSGNRGSSRASGMCPALPCPAPGSAALPSPDLSRFSPLG